MISVLQLGTMEYATAFRLQQSLIELRHSGAISDVLLLLEHDPVITLGRNASQKNLLASSDLLRNKGVELFESNRGGDITFHGPGQLVGYPIFDLRAFSPRLGAVEFVRRMEEALIRTCGDLGIATERICGLTGVWTQGAEPQNCSGSSSQPQREQKKIAAIGIHISRGITSHGFALNVNTDLDYFKMIVPCGISDRAVTTIAQELASERSVPTMEQVAHAVSLNFGRVFARQMLCLDSLEALLSTTTQPQQSEESESTTIGVPLRIPDQLREIRRQQRSDLAQDETSLV